MIEKKNRHAAAALFDDRNDQKRLLMTNILLKRETGLESTVEPNPRRVEP